jgi:deoxycytidylate deaminase
MFLGSLRENCRPAPSTTRIAPKAMRMFSSIQIMRLLHAADNAGVKMNSHGKSTAWTISVTVVQEYRFDSQQLYDFFSKQDWGR